MKIQSFNKGLNTRVAPQFLELNEATVYENVDNSVGVLAPVKKKASIGVPGFQHSKWFDANNELLTGEEVTEYVEFQKKMYYTRDGEQPKKYDGTTTHNLGIVAPVLKAVAVSNHGLKPPTEVQVDSDLLGDLPNIIARYLIVNTDDLYASRPLAVQYDFTHNSPGYHEPNNRRQTYGDYVRARGYADYYAGMRNRSLTFTDIQVAEFGPLGVQVYRLYNGTYYLVGTAFTDTDVITDDVYDISANADYADVIPPIDAQLQYVYTFYNSADGTESAPSPASDIVTILGAASLTNIQVSSDPQVDKKRLYRVGEDITAFSLVAELNNSEETYKDEVNQTAIVATILTSQNNQPPPTDLRFLREAYAMMFGASGSTLHFSAIGEPDYWSAFNTIKFSSDITGIAPVANGIIVLTKYNSYLITGASPTELSKYVLSADQGCIGSQSIQFVSGSAVWASSDGLCISEGDNVKVLSKDKLGKIALTTVSSVIHDEVYYLLQEDNSILALDMRFGPVYRRLNLGVDGLVIINDVLSGHFNGTIYSLLVNSESEELKYRSPKFISGKITEEKMYKKVYIYSEGDIIVKIYIDGSLVLTKSLSGTGNNQLQIPHNKQRGHYLEVEIEGSGTVHEYEYVIGNKKND